MAKLELEQKQKLKQLEKENICLKRRLIHELTNFNTELEKQKLTNKILSKEILQLKQRNAYLELVL